MWERCPERSAEEIRQLFEQLYAAIDADSKTAQADKEDLKAEFEDIQVIVTEALQKNEKVEESFLSRHFRNIARVTQDVLDVVMATLENPLVGVDIAVKKIAEKAKAEVATDSGSA